MDPVFRTIAVLFAANKINDAYQRKVILLTIIRPMAFKLLRSLVAPEKLEYKSYSDLVEAMMKHHNLKLSEIMQCYKFNTWFRQQGESISKFMWELRALHVAEFCNYGTSLDTMLHDQLACEINNLHIQHHLLSKPSLTLKTAMQIVLGMETVAQNAKPFRELVKL